MFCVNWLIKVKQKLSKSENLFVRQKQEKREPHARGASRRGLRATVHTYHTWYITYLLVERLPMCLLSVGLSVPAVDTTLTSPHLASPKPFLWLYVCVLIHSSGWVSVWVSGYPTTITWDTIRTAICFSISRARRPWLLRLLRPLRPLSVGSFRCGAACARGNTRQRRGRNSHFYPGASSAIKKKRETLPSSWEMEMEMEEPGWSRDSALPTTHHRPPLFFFFFSLYSRFSIFNFFFFFWFLFSFAVLCLPGSMDPA